MVTTLVSVNSNFYHLMLSTLSKLQITLYSKKTQVMLFLSAQHLMKQLDQTLDQKTSTKQKQPLIFFP